MPLLCAHYQYVVTKLKPASIAIPIPIRIPKYVLQSSSFIHFKSKHRLKLCYCSSNEHQQLPLEAFSALDCEPPWEGGSVWSNMGLYFFSLHVPMSFGGLSVVAQMLNQPNLDPQTKAVAILSIETLELFGALLLLQFTARPQYKPVDFKFNKTRGDRNWVFAALLGFVILVAAISLTSLIADRLFENEGVNNQVLKEILSSSSISRTACTLVYCIVAPLLEEIIYRGILLTSLVPTMQWHQAVIVSEWMKEKHPSSFSAKDTATQLQLICRVHGLEAAEKYFNDLPITSRTRVVFYALLNCYGSTKSMRKAEDLMQKMKKLGFANNTLPYNIMLNLYMQLEMYDKFKQVMEEMDKMGFIWDTFTYRVLLNAYSSSGKVSEMETVLMKMEADPVHSMRHAEYITTANGYLKAGIVDKSLIMLKRAEHLANDKVKKHVYHCLLTLYAHAKAKEEVFRIWHLYKKSWDVYNKGYLSMVSALAILGDLEEAEKIIDEWVEELGNKGLDSKVVNILVRAYGEKGDLEKAEALINRVRKTSGQEIQRSTWATMAIGYQIHNQMENSVKTMKKALLTDRADNWVLSKVSLVRCLNFLKREGNPEELKEFESLLEKIGYNTENLLSGNTEDDGEEKPTFEHEAEEDLESDDVIVQKVD